MNLHFFHPIMPHPLPCVRLVYENEKPTFELHGFHGFTERGQYLSLEFGVIHAGIDNISYPAIYFSIEPKKRGTGWKVVFVEPIFFLKNGPDFLYLKPGVLKLVDDLNEAIRQQKEIDLWEFQKQYTDQFGDAFRMDVSNNSAKGYFTIDGFVKNWFETHSRKQGDEE